MNMPYLTSEADEAPIKLKTRLREESDNYPVVVAILTDRWRVIPCRTWVSWSTSASSCTTALCSGTSCRINHEPGLPMSAIGFEHPLEERPAPVLFTQAAYLLRVRSRQLLI